MRQWNLGVIGLGEGRSIISAALASPQWNLAGLCDTDAQRCHQRCEEFDLDPSIATTSYDDLLADDRVDVISIYTPDDLHAEHARRAMDAGKHVICTKPLLPGLDDAAELLEAQRRSGKQLMVGQSSRFTEAIFQQREDFEAGHLGALLTVESHYYHDHRQYMRKSWASGGRINWVYGGLSHPVDLVRWYMPDIEVVSGYGLISPDARELGQYRPDTMHFVLRAASGAIGRVSGTYGSPTFEARTQKNIECTLRGQRGVSRSYYPELHYHRRLQDDAGQIQSEDFDHSDKYNYYYRFGGTSHHAGEFQNYLDHFARCLGEAAPPSPDLMEGIGTLGVLAAMERSMKTETPVRVADLMAEYDLEALSPARQATAGEPVG